MKEKNLVKILMVDDLPENLFALELILSNENYSCIKANSGNEALKILLHEQDFSLILMDVQMPEMDGLETVELIREIEALKYVPIIFLTASMDSSFIFKGYEAGGVDFMIKPIIPEILKAKVAVFVDLYKKTNELIIQKSLSQYSLSLIEASHDPLFAINQEGKITDINNASEKVTGVLREKLINSDFSDYFTEPRKARKVYREGFAKGFIADWPLTFQQINGKLSDVLFNGSVYKDDKGNIIGVVIVARDVTEQKRIATELKEAKFSAEQARAIAELAQSKAESATLIAEDAVKAKQQFLSNMSHEIRTPMNAIIGFTKVILTTELNEKQKEYLNAIKVSGATLIVLINDILDLAKVDAGKMTFEQTPFKLASSLSTMLHLFETEIHEKNLKLVKEYDSRIPEVLIGDPTRLHQVILNLVSNAVKFTTEGKITVSAKMLSEDAEKVTINFAVSDTGIGIPESKLGGIFDDFQQATSGTARLFGGTGLGLAIVKKLIEPQGGSVNVTSKEGKGSEFSFVLDFKKTTAILENEIDSIIEVEVEEGQINILVVEDIALNQLLMATLLEEFGFNFEIAENGKIAVEKLKANSYDLILMDLQMPVMNGFEATEYIRNTLKLDIPIIAVTANVTTVDIDKCKAVGMNDYISKPVDDKLLYNKIIQYSNKVHFKEVKVQEKASEDTINERCINLDYLKKLCKNNLRLTEIINIYLSEIPALVVTMQQSIENRDWKVLKIAAHSIIPSFLTMGICSDYELSAKKIQEIANEFCNNDSKKVTKVINNVLISELKKIEEVCKQACIELRIDILTFAN